jgi:hypothetical protein
MDRQTMSKGLITSKILNKQTNKQKKGLLAATCKGDDNGMDHTLQIETNGS